MPPVTPRCAILKANTARLATSPGCGAVSMTDTPCNPHAIVTSRYRYWASEYVAKVSLQNELVTMGFRLLRHEVELLHRLYQRSPEQERTATRKAALRGAPD